MNSTPFASIEDALDDLRAGKMVVVVDDEDRENEGDLVALAEGITPEAVNFMATHARGLICVPLVDQRCDELDLHAMVDRNTDPHGTAFTVSVDLDGDGVSTGISASDRAKTINALARPGSKAADFRRPGHIFPLRARPGGVLRRAGHTEAAIDLARLAGSTPAGVIVEIMNEDGSMARLPELELMAAKHDLRIISIEQLIRYRMERDRLVHEVHSYRLDSPYGPWHVRIYGQTTSDQRHASFSFGTWHEQDEVLVRMQSGPFTGSPWEAFGMGGTRDTAHFAAAMRKIAEVGSGCIVCLNQRGTTPDWTEWDPTSPPQPTKSMGHDPLDYGVGAQILHGLGLRQVALLTQNPMRRVGIEGYGLHIVRNVALYDGTQS